MVKEHIDLFCTIYFINASIQWINIAFAFDIYSLSPFFLITFSNISSFWFSFCNSFSRNVPIISSPLKSSIKYVYGTVFYFFNYKNFFKAIWSISSKKNVFVFWYSYMITNFKFKIFINTFFTFNINRFPFNSFLKCTIVCIYGLYRLIYQCTHFFGIEVMYL